MSNYPEISKLNGLLTEAIATADYSSEAKRKSSIIKIRKSVEDLVRKGESIDGILRRISIISSEFDNENEKTIADW